MTPTQAPASPERKFERSLVEAILEASPDGILVVDAQGVITCHNHRLFEVLGIPRMSMLRSVAIGEGEEAAATCSLDRLSDREMQVFELIGKGMTTRETADRLNLSVKTVETYRENIKVKLMLENNNELICRAAQWVVQEEGGDDPMTDLG